VAVEAAPTATVGVRRLLRRNAALRRTPMSESGGGHVELNQVVFLFFIFYFFLLLELLCGKPADRG
jgi:hypothetical protein